MIFYGKIINEWKGIIEGEALVSKKRISFLGDVDPRTGIIHDLSSDIYGKTIASKILIFRGGRGSTVGASVIYSLKKYMNAPSAFITVETDPVIVSGAIFSDIPMLSNVKENILEDVQSGDLIRMRIEGRKGIIEVQK